MGERRDAYLAKLKTKLDEWNADIDRLQAKADQIRTDARTEYQNQVENLKEKRADLEERVANMVQSGDGAWKELRTSADRAWRAMEKSVRAARSRFK